MGDHRAELVAILNFGKIVIRVSDNVKEWSVNTYILFMGNSTDLPSSTPKMLGAIDQPTLIQFQIIATKTLLGRGGGRTLVRRRKGRVDVRRCESTLWHFKKSNEILET